MKNFLSAIIIILLPLITWAQNNNVQRPHFPEGEEPEHRIAGQGGDPEPDIPIDEYQYMLLALAIVLMVYVYYTYKKRARTQE